jgi:uncharacterized damage-inducible protein DinB
VYTPEALLDLHGRGHRSLRRLLEHVEGLAPAALDRELDGFGYPTVRRQLAHVIGAEHYWIGVLHGVIDAEDRDDLYPTARALEGWRQEVAARTEAYLRAADAAELDTPRRMTTWGGREQVLVPARVVLRTFTHLYHHQGQVVAMCRLLGRPAEGLDFPIA